MNDAAPHEAQISAHANRKKRVKSWISQRGDDVLEGFQDFAIWLNEPLQKNRPLVWRIVFPDHYPRFTSVYVLTILASLVYGADFFFIFARSAWEIDPGQRVAESALLLLAFLILLFVNFRAIGSKRVSNYLLAYHLALFSLVAGVILLFEFWPVESFPANSLTMIDAHAGHAAMLILAISLGICWVVAHCAFRGDHAATVREWLPYIELFQPRERFEHRSEDRRYTYVFAFLRVVLTYSFQVIFPAAAIYVLLPENAGLWILFPITASLIATILFCVSTINERISTALDSLGRMFFRGPQLFVSILVVAIAVLRYRDNHYIDYLFQVDEGWISNPSIIAYILFAYVLSWYYAFWSEHFLARRMICLLNGQEDGNTPADISYPYYGSEKVSDVSKEGRRIFLHGSGRLELRGTHTDERTRSFMNPRAPHQFPTPREIMATFGLQVRHPHFAPRPPTPSPGEVGPGPAPAAMLGIAYDRTELKAMKLHPSHASRVFRDLYRNAAAYELIAPAIAILAFGGAFFLLVTYFTMQPPQVVLIDAAAAPNETADAESDAGKRVGSLNHASYAATPPLKLFAPAEAATSGEKNAAGIPPVPAPAPASLIDLAELLGGTPAPSDPCAGALTPDTPRIAIAASGGGTRAALYTASLLRGLAKAGHGCKIALLSGVSGGSAALGYFAIHHEKLRHPGAILDDAPWKEFLDKMAQPFIQLVIRDASALRISVGLNSWRAQVCDEAAASTLDPNIGHEILLPLTRSRLGHLLAEGFVCELGSRTMGEIPFALMLNTSLLGRFSSDEAPCGEGARSLSERISDCKDFLLSDIAGGRLVMGNLTPAASPESQPLPNPCLDTDSDTPAFSRPVTATPIGSLEFDQMDIAQMDIVALNRTDIPVARAAALSGNFPPIFPDAAIDILCDRADYSRGQRYWVTDGGAVENRGTLTMLLAIRQAISQQTENSNAQQTEDSKLAPLHLVIADVSREGGTYEETFGLGSVLNAGSQLGLQLEREILDDIVEIYEKAGVGIYVYDLKMPTMFRNQGIGTHWMLPSSLTFTEPLSLVQEDRAPRTIMTDRRTIIDIVAMLHDPGWRSFTIDDPGLELYRWSTEEGAADHLRIWRRLGRDLGLSSNPFYQMPTP